MNTYINCTADTPMLTETVLAERSGPYGRRYLFLHRTPGRRAGVGCWRGQETETWGAIMEDRNGTRYGQWYRDRRAAQEHFDRMDG